MIRFDKFQPTAFDSRSNYVNHSKISREHWYVLGFMHSRDTDMIHESNWQAIQDILKPDKTAGVEIHRFNHWGCGWYELILIHPWNKKAIEQAEDIEYQLNNYPVLDENDLSEREMEDQDQAWQNRIEHEFREALNEALDIDCDNVEESNLFFYFRDLCDKSNTYIETDYQYGSSIDIDSVVAAATLESALIALPEVRLSAENFADLPHSSYHAIAPSIITPKVGDKPHVLLDLEGNTLEIPDFIAVQYDKRQLTIC